MKSSMLKLFLSIVLILSPIVFADSKIDLKNVSNWDIWFIYGYSRIELNNIEIPYNTLMPYYLENGVTGLIGISTPLSPLHVINKKSTPIWYAVFTKALFEEGALEAAYNGKQEIMASHSFVRSNYGGHINWPDQYVKKYYPEMTSCFPFVLPFMVPAKTEVKEGKRFEYNEHLVVEGIKYFDENKPENMLSIFRKNGCSRE